MFAGENGNGSSQMNVSENGIYYTKDVIVYDSINIAKSLDSNKDHLIKKINVRKTDTVRLVLKKSSNKNIKKSIQNVDRTQFQKIEIWQTESSEHFSKSAIDSPIAIGSQQRKISKFALVEIYYFSAFAPTFSKKITFEKVGFLRSDKIEFKSFCRPPPILFS